MINKKNNWIDFWSSYRKIDADCDADLFIQVGKTINGIPISSIRLQEMVNDICSNLNLQSSDSLFEMCCGNGLLTLPLSKIVNKVYAFDFTSDLVATALKFCNNSNINYTVADANSNFFNNFKFEEKPTKYLMNDSLAYFKPNELLQIINRIIEFNRKFTFYLTGVPNNALMWNFYNTEERKKLYFESVKKGDIFLDGIGNWWNMQDIYNIAKQFSLECEIINSIDNYRSNILFKNV